MGAVDTKDDGHLVVYNNFVSRKYTSVTEFIARSLSITATSFQRRYAVFFRKPFVGWELNFAETCTSLSLVVLPLLDYASRAHETEIRASSARPLD